jgi:glycosyltransferase involved in cell wall biosynthesis
MDAGAPSLQDLAQDLQSWGVRRVHVLAWRDLDDPDAGGSEVHADEFMRRWSAVGLQIVQRTSAAAGRPSVAERNGYRVVRRGGRYSVFARAVASELAHRMGPRDALVEVWNGVPWFSPLWFRGPRITVFHHVHGPMWDQLFGLRTARLGRALEATVAPPFYRRTPVVTPSEATRTDLIEILGLRPDRVTVVPNGVDPFWCPGGAKALAPTVVACGRMAPVKRFGLLLEAARQARQRVPGLRLVVVGEGPERAHLEKWVALNDADGWVELPGSLSRTALRDRYREAWIVASTSLAEGWGLTMTEAAACGTPAVATDIGGHRWSVLAGETGVLCPPEDLGAAMASLLLDGERRRRMGERARIRASALTWDATALGILGVLHGDAARRREASTRSRVSSMGRRSCRSGPGAEEARA